jgi:diguanylate cyclase (GGDEF)-like protein/PAS domain S-box-containing protein
MVTGIPRLEARVSVDGVDLHAVLQSAPLGLGVIEPSGRFVLVNAALARAMGRPASEVLGAEAVSFLHPDEREAARSSLEEMFAGWIPGTRWERRYLRPSGSVVWGRVITAAVPTPNGPPRAVVMQLQDITAERAVAEAQLELASMVSVLAEAVVTFDGAGQVRTWNRAAQELLGWSALDMLGRPISNLVPPERMAEHRAWMARLHRGETVREDAERLHRDGSTVPVHLTATPVVGPDGRMVSCISLLQDFGPQKRDIQRLERLARRDPVTGLPNRQHFNELLAQTLGPNGPDVVGLLFLDLDRFKDVNDQHGHLVGDEFLRVVGARLRGALRPGDTVSRWGGDEFAVLVERAAGPAEVAAVADRLLEALERPLHLRMLDLPVAVSIGVVVARAGDRPDELLAQGDAAMYLAKSRGGNQWAGLESRAG